MKSQVRVMVEVTDEVTSTASGKAKQVVYVDIGARYPERMEIFQPDSGPLRPGQYVVEKLRKGRFDVELDFRSLKPVQPAAASKAS